LENWLIGLIGFVAYFGLTLLKIPIGLSGILVGFAGLSFIIGLNPSIKTLGIIPFDALHNPAYIVVALFILTGELAYAGGLGDDLFETARKWLRVLPGGLALAQITACGAFGTISGSSQATVAVMGRTALPELIKNKYDVKLAAGVTACAGTFGILIPPSTTLIFYAIFVEQPVGPLFLASLIPAAITVILYMFTVILMVKLKPSLVPVVDFEPPKFKEKVVALKVAIGPVLVFTTVIGGLYTGFATPSELASFAVAVILVYVFIARRLKLGGLWESLKATARMTTAVFYIILGAFILIPFLALSGFTNVFISWISNLAVDRYLTFAALIGMYFILGMFLPNLAMMALTLPLVFPLIVSLDFNPIWFGIVILKMIEIANVTPPFGMNIFVLKSVIDEGGLSISHFTLFSSVWPFVLCDLAVVGFLLAFPNVVLFFR